jgi:hypothetical protein
MQVRFRRDKQAEGKSGEGRCEMRERPDTRAES